METNLLKDWHLKKCHDNIVIVIGTVYNDIKGRFADGERIHTSRVLRADFVNGVVETLNSVYHLDMSNNLFD